MPNTSITKNYFAHGGNELVLGGKVTILPGAMIEGAEGLFGRLPENAPPPLPFQADSSATTVAALKEDFNALLIKLRAAGIMEMSVPDQDEGGDAR